MQDYLNYLIEKVSTDDTLVSALKKDTAKKKKIDYNKKVNNAVLDGDSSDLPPTKSTSTRQSKEAYLRSKLGLKRTEPDAVSSSETRDGNTMTDLTADDDEEEEEEEESEMIMIDENVQFKWVIRNGKKVKKYFINNVKQRKFFRVQMVDGKPRVKRMKPSEKRNRRIAQRLAKRKGGRAKGQAPVRTRKIKRSWLRGIQNGVYRDRQKLTANTLRQNLGRKQPK